ncbi:MAG: bifunctional precorrin-2 dehydrogenase/sirohydrochlorin ferrochelatase, partial [Eubacterium sp.]|nr:bifunctional precorrin-2 dehydrogenase/sirohydrochlorin ferrochelatase [Eubacterium sp.]
VGGGEVACRKVVALLHFGVHICMKAQNYCEELQALEKREAYEGRLKLIYGTFDKEDLKDVFFVIAATDNAELNREISVECQNRGILVNAVDQKELCSFYFPSLVKKEDLVVGISSGGNSPGLAKKIRKKVEAEIPDYYAPLNRQLGSVREQVLENISTESARKKCFEEIIALGEREKRELTQVELENILKKFFDNNS